MKDEIVEIIKDIGGYFGLSGLMLPIVFGSIIMYFIIVPDIKKWKELNFDGKATVVVFSFCYISLFLVYIKELIFGK